MEDEKRSSKPSHSWGPVGCSEWPYQAALPCHVIIELLRPFRGHTSIISGGANHGGTMPKRWAKERRKGGKGREGPASALRRERTQMSSHQRPARPAGQPRETEFPSLAHSAWKTKGCRVGEGSRDALPGWASRWIVRRISGVLSWGWCLSLRRGKRQGQKQRNATQRNATKMARRTPHARRGTPTPLQCVALHPLARLALSLTLISQQNRTTGPHLSHLCLQRLGLPMRRSGAPASRGLELSRQRWGSHRGLEFGSESRDGGPVLYPTAHHESIIRPSLRF
jgi:hypothetical protein